jgi:hypothetical protein
MVSAEGGGAETGPATDALPTVANSQAIMAAGAAWSHDPFSAKQRSACMLSTVSALQDWPTVSYAACRMRIVAIILNQLHVWGGKLDTHPFCGETANSVSMRACLGRRWQL